ncbi:MAG: fatty acid hydroxylase [Bacteroidetes bacterium]|nr:MAG: fatty acid hydroxylase [Bacteroidota bacterium]
MVIGTLLSIALGLFWFGIQASGLGMSTRLLVALVGLFSFSLAEYLIHRFVYHSGDYHDLVTWQDKIHGTHHAFPRAKTRLTMPLPVLVPVATLVISALWLLMGPYAFGFFPGILVGYALYLWVHYILHTRRPPKGFFRYWWKHHYLHHYKYDDKAFGLTSPIWDIVFGTMPPR